jgi:hypothetical protein
MSVEVPLKTETTSTLMLGMITKIGHDGFSELVPAWRAHMNHSPLMPEMH